MKVLAFYSDKDLDKAIADAMIDGVRAAGHKGRAIEGAQPDEPDADLVVLLGVKARERFEAYRALGVGTVMVDKGYHRRRVYMAGGRKVSRYWRVSVNAHHPTRYLMQLAAGPERWAALGLSFLPWRESLPCPPALSDRSQKRPLGQPLGGEGHILLAGSSGKFHEFNGLGEPTAYAAGIVARIREHSGRPVIYRPKPSWRDAVPIEGAAFSPPKQTLAEVLAGAHALVTNGSNACFEAVLAGVPVVVLGDAVARPISSTSLDEIETPRLADAAERLQWLHNLAECQWTLDEMAAGLAFRHVLKVLDL